MPVDLQPGSKLKGYTIVKCLNRGNMALAYDAKDAQGKRVFLKSYTSPSPSVVWYDDYRKYIDKMNARLQGSAVADFCVLPLEAFEAKVSPMSKKSFFYQTFPFIEGGHDLRKLLGDDPRDLRHYSWNDRLTHAKVFMHSMGLLHKDKVVHCDLKPENIQLIDNRGKGGLPWVPRLIDMDRSILADVQAPWHKHGEGYTGTPHYMSPEHFVKGGCPTTASDVFTCGIILIELLAGVHPFSSVSKAMPEPYMKAVQTGDHDYKNAKLRLLVAPESPECQALAAMLLECLSPQATKRPTCSDVFTCLSKVSNSEDAMSDASDTPTPVPPKNKKEIFTKIPTGGLVLIGDKAKATIRIPHTYGKIMLADIAEQAKFASSHQFKLHLEDNLWFIEHCPFAKNMTVLNGEKIIGKVCLKLGDEIALQGSTGKRTMQLKVDFK